MKMTEANDGDGQGFRRFERVHGPLVDCTTQEFIALPPPAVQQL